MVEKMTKLTQGGARGAANGTRMAGIGSGWLVEKKGMGVHVDAREELESSIGKLLAE